jgi:pteridine reductase
VSANGHLEGAPTSDTRSLSGKTALVTGAAHRLGRAVAEALADRGCGVVVHYHSSAVAADRVVEAIRALGVPAAAVRADLSDPQRVEGFWREALAAARRPIHILVNAAASFPADDLASLEPGTLETAVRLNALAPALLSRLFAAEHAIGRERRGGAGDKAGALQGGTIVNILDARMEAPLRRHVSYGLSKQMLADLTRLMALEYAPHVRVNAVAPGLVLPPPGMEEEQRRRLARMNLLERWGEPGDVARAVVYLAESPFVTGQVLYVDGGGTLRGGAGGGRRGDDA